MLHSLLPPNYRSKIQTINHYLDAPYWRKIVLDSQYMSTALPVGVSKCLADLSTEWKNCQSPDAVCAVESLAKTNDTFTVVS